MGKSKYLYRSLLFSSINSNNFCGFFSGKSDKNKKEQIEKQEQNLSPAPVQNSNQQEDKKPGNPGEPNPNQKPKQNPGDPKKGDRKPVQKEDYMEKIKEILGKTYNDITYWNLKNNCYLYFCRFNKNEDGSEKTDDKGNKVEKHFVYIYASYLDNYKLIAKTKYVTSEKEELEYIIKRKTDVKFKLLGFKSVLPDSQCFELWYLKYILKEYFLKLCDSKGNLINKINEPLITISLTVYGGISGKTEKYDLWLGLINNNLYFETSSKNGKKLLIPMKVFDYERIKYDGKCDYSDIYAYSNDDKGYDKLYFYRLKNNATKFGLDDNIEGAPTDYFKIEGNNFKDICGAKNYDIKIGYNK